MPSHEDLSITGLTRAIIAQRKMQQHAILLQQMKVVKKLANNRKRQHKMMQIGFACSLLLLAVVCAAHLLLHEDKRSNNIAKFNRLQHLRTIKADAFVQSKLEKLSFEMANFPTIQYLSIHVNMLLTEQRRRTERHRSPTPIPSLVRPLRRQYNSASNSENWPPNVEPSTSNAIYNPDGQGSEPTLMDLDAIDTYWHWDIDQEKGTLATMVQQEQFNHGYTTAEQHEGSTEEFYERDIQLLAEKNLIPLLPNQNPYQHANSGQFGGEDQEENYLLTDISHNKWERSLQWPTTSNNMHETAHQFGQDLLQFYGLEDVPLFLSADESGNTKLCPSQADNADEGIDTDLLNIPVATPQGSHQLGSEVITHEEASTSCQLLPFLSSPSTSNLDQRILFNDVSLAEAVNSEETDQQDVHQRDNSTSLQLLQNLSIAEPECERDIDTEEDMLLSTLFPQLFPPTTLTNPSLQMNSIMGNNENNRVDEILRDMAAAELLINSISNTTFQAQIQQQQLPVLHVSQQQQLPLASPIYASQNFATPTIAAPLPPLLLMDPLSPSILEQINHTLMMTNLASPSSAIGNQMVLQQDNNGFNNSDYQHHQNGTVSARCTSATSSGFGSSAFEDSQDSFPVNAGKSETVGSAFASRYENKLLPKSKSMKNKEKVKGAKEEIVKIKGKRGRRSKDDSLVNQHGLPFSAERLSEMSYREYAAIMQSGLNAEQKALIKKIRRRGRNKLAARKCRERRLKGGSNDGRVKEEEDEEWEEFDEDVEVVSNNGDMVNQQCAEYDEDAYEPQLASLCPSTSYATNSAQQFPSKLRAGLQTSNDHRRKAHPTSSVIRVQV